MEGLNLLNLLSLQPTSDTLNLQSTYHFYTRGAPADFNHDLILSLDVMKFDRTFQIYKPRILTMTAQDILVSRRSSYQQDVLIPRRRITFAQLQYLGFSSDAMIIVDSNARKLPIILKKDQTLISYVIAAYIRNRFEEIPLY